MIVSEFVQNIKKYCDIKGVKPTVACKESGAGKDLINQIETRGSIPSVAKVQMLADYLGVTTSELLGETSGPGDKKAPATISGSCPDFLIKFESLSPDDQDEVMAIVEMKLARKEKQR